jgi:two-component system NtrC family sensor kinase
VHRLLERQLQKHLDPLESTDARLAAFIASVDAAYRAEDADRALLERSMELVSEELFERNTRLARELEAVQRLELELRQAEKLRAVGQLASGIAHEINTPIQYVGDSVHFLREAGHAFARLGQILRDASGAGGDAAATLGALEAEARRMDLDFVLEEVPKAVEQAQDGLACVANIVAAMKEFGSTDSRDKTLADPNHCLETTLIIAQNEVKHVADVELRLGEVPLIPCFPGELNQVLLSLILNAAHAVRERFGETGQRGVIRAATAHEGRSVVLTITDNGSGILPEHQCRIFEPFFTTKAVGAGSGQGLALARWIVMQKHGGSISFDSTPGEGTTFSVHLPDGEPEDSRLPRPSGREAIP